MKKMIFMAAGLLMLNFCAQAQMIVGFKLSPGIAATHVKDRNGAFDGYTQNEGNRKVIGIGASIDFGVTDNWYFGTGLWFTQKNLYIRNSIGGYSGVSNYNLAYLQIPALLKYRTGEVFTDKLNLVFGGGPMLDLKLHEAVAGGDGAQFMNLAHNVGGSNGNYKTMPLFAPANLGLYLSAGAEYQLLKIMGLYAGFSVNPSFINMINHRLLYNNAVKTPLHDDLKITTTLISFDLGVKFNVKK